jgi:probable phosphoglycerate mutase
LEVDFGEWTDQKLKALSKQKQWKVVQNTPSLHCFPGGETFASAQARVVSALSDLAAKHDEKDLIACVSHSDTIKLAVAYFIGLPLDMFQRLHVSPGSVTGLMLTGSGARLLTLNYEFSFTLPKA